VKNGTLGTIERIESPADRKAAGVLLHVRLDDDRRLAVDTAQYGHFDHGYALTVHKSQGVTVDRAYVLATKSMHAELAYVAMTRHKENLIVVGGRDEFADGAALMRSLSRADDKSFSAQHELRPERDRRPEMGYRHTLNQRRVEFSNAPRTQRAEKTLDRAVEQYADALSAATAANQAGKPVPAKDRAALKRARAGLDLLDRAAALVNEVAQARAQRAGIEAPAAGQPRPTSAATVSRRFADMTPEERQERRNEFKAQLREAAGQPTERSKLPRESTKSPSRSGPEIGD
jgi:ATP-dependent exoDNAse (exonuclease V) beta subunit